MPEMPEPRIHRLIKASSLGTPEAEALRATVSDETAAQILARAEQFRCICDPNVLFDPPDPRPVAVEGCPAHVARRSAQQLTRVFKALAKVCGYHEGDDCSHCLESFMHHRAKGRTFAEILADIELYRTDRGAWEAKVRAGRPSGESTEGA